MAGLSRSLRPEILGRVLTLLLIWGLTIFGWGSLSAWQQGRQETDLATTLQTLRPTVQAWLEQEFAPLDQLAENPLLQQALLTPLGLGSPAVQRVLNAKALILTQADVVLVDLATGRSLRPPGAGRLPPEVQQQLADLPTRPRQLIASGSRSASLYFAVQVPGGVEQEVYAVLGKSLRALAVTVPPALTAVATRGASTGQPQVWLQLPHLNGTAWWAAHDPHALSFSAPPLKLAAWQPLGLGELELGFGHPTAPPALYGLPHALLLGVALLASLLVLWPATAPLRAQAQLQGKKLAPLGQRLWGPLATMAGKLKPKPREEGADFGPDEGPLLSGTGIFGGTGFGAGRPKVSLGRRRALRPPKPSAAEPDRDGEAPDTDPDTLATRVLTALAQGRLELRYQPMYDLTENLPQINEVLARLHDGEESLAPAQFLPVLEDAGKLAELDALVFQKVLKSHFGPGKTAPTKLSLNVSGTSLEDIGYLRDMVQQGRHVLQSLVLELRSNELVRDPKALKLVKTLQGQGMSIAVDYFGGGAPMIEATKAIGLDYVKFNVQRLTENRSNKRELLELCLLARKLGVNIIGERVEDAATIDFMRRAGATLLQGYGLCPPQESPVTLPLAALLRGQSPKPSSSSQAQSPAQPAA